MTHGILNRDPGFLITVVHVGMFEKKTQLIWIIPKNTEFLKRKMNFIGFFPTFLRCKWPYFSIFFHLQVVVSMTLCLNSTPWEDEPILTNILYIFFFNFGLKTSPRFFSLAKRTRGDFSILKLDPEASDRWNNVMWFLLVWLMAEPPATENERMSLKRDHFEGKFHFPTINLQAIC